MDGYGEDLSAIHDAGFAELAEAAARMVADVRPPPARVADLGCGSGILLESLLEAGYGIWGCDQSEAMVALARKRVPGATVSRGDALSADVPRSDVVVAVGEVLNHALAGHGPAALAPFLVRIRQALRPGGLFLFDVATARREEATHAEREGPGWRLAAVTETDGAHRTRTIDTWRDIDGGARRAREVHRLLLLDRQAVEASLRDAGFTVEVLAGYDDFAFEPGWDGFLATA